MMQWLRRSLLMQLLGVYLLFVALVLGMGIVVNTIVQRQLRTEVQASDLALAQAIALETDTKLRNARDSLADLVNLEAVQQGNIGAMITAFRAFSAARPDVDRVYWLDGLGMMQASVPTDLRTIGTDFSQEHVFRQARSADGPFVEGGVVDLTTFNAVAVVAAPVRDDRGYLRGVVATNLLLDDFSAPLRTIIAQQAHQNQRLIISMIDEEGHLIATPERERLLQPVIDELPGAAQALHNQSATQIGRGPRGIEWLYSAVSVPSVGWAVVVQRPTADALAVVRSFSTWLTIATVLFGVGGLMFWLMLMRRVFQPLRVLAAEHRALPPREGLGDQRTPVLARRRDEIGRLSHSLQRLEHDVHTRLSELETLLETSNAVVGTLEPRTVVGTIIREVQRLVNVQAAAVMVSDDQGNLRVLASEGRADWYDRSIRVPLDTSSSPAARALREGHPIQMLIDRDADFPHVARQAGFQVVLTIPIVSSHTGNVVLVVHRKQLVPFTPAEINLLLTFANYATLAWEHAVLYERSDERLREIAHENERLYCQATQEKQTLAALMGSMSDGLVLASSDGRVLYANPGASALIGVTMAELEHAQLSTIHQHLKALTAHPAEYERALRQPHRADRRAWLIETTAAQERALALRQFDVCDESGAVIGQGLLLRDVTAEHEVDQFKTTLLAAVGHELRTPLAAIEGHASTLLQDDVCWSPADQRHFLQTISTEADRLAQMVTNLLDLSRFEAGLLPLHREPWLLPDLIAAAVERVNRPIQHLSLDVAAHLPSVYVDRSRIEVVLRNIIANAATYGSGHVAIAADTRNGGIVLHIADDGPGIAVAELPHVFERFYRAERGMRQRSGGTGLGLAIAKAFVEAHGGNIWIDSTSTGTTISFTLPIDGPAPQVERAV